MDEENRKDSSNCSRRKFLQTVGTGVPTLSLMMQGEAAAGGGGEPGADQTPDKFTPVDLSRHFTGSSTDFGQRERAKSMGGESAHDGLIRMPAGKQALRGIPFWLGPEGVHVKSWVILSTNSAGWATRSSEIRLAKKAGFICLAAFCDWDKNESPSPNEDVIENVGQRLADAILVYEDGSEKSLPIRRRFEVCSPTVRWGQEGFASRTHLLPAFRKLTDPLPQGTDWGALQTAVWDNNGAPGPWISALPNPEPERTLKALRLVSAAGDPLVVCGVTLFHGQEHPLRLKRLSLYRITLPEPAAEEENRWKVDVDLGVVARTYMLNPFDPGTWLNAPDAGLGERFKPVEKGQHLFAEVTACAEATLSLHDRKTGRRYQFDLAQWVPGRELEARPAGPRVEILEAQKVWLHAQVVDQGTQRPASVRLAFRSKEGRYIPPYGHCTEINAGWFQDYGADVKLMGSSFAYVDGTFQVELPVGEVYVEISKGFEYDIVRQKLNIAPGQRELKLEVSRFTDLRSRGWVTADTHVHFVSPSTAILEGQAEGVNLTNLLAAQWGDLFTNVGDIPQGPLTSRDGETIVHVGTENRQHLLGHLGLLGVKGEPVFPMSADGPSEAYLGTPTWNSMAEWADACRARDGLALSVHFPYPSAEIAADVVLGKIDAVEMRPSFDEHFSHVVVLDWYRYLNCGYRLPVVGGTDKMGAYMAIGAERTYAYLGQEEFNFANWAKAVRRGNTFMTSGPLLLFQVDGHTPGDEITLGAGGGTVEVKAEATSFVPIHRVEIVMNGRVVATRENAAGTRQMILQEKIQVPGPGWLAARCVSRLGPVTTWEFLVCAHTSPVYVAVPGQELFSSPAASYFLTLIEGSETYLDNLAIQADPERMARIRKTLVDAREHLHRRLHAHGAKH